MTITRPIAWIDCETTGVDAVKDRIIEFAVTVMRPNAARTEWVQRFNPETPIPAASTAIHGITDADVAGCPPFKNFAAKILAGLTGKDIGGYNLWRLDLAILDEEMRRCRLKLDLTGVSLIDAYGIFSKKEPRKLEDAVRRYCKREHSGAHGAGPDASAAMEVFIAQVQEYPDLAGMTLDQIAEFSRLSEFRYADVAGKLYIDADGDVVFAFGKAKGTKVRDDPGFADWILRKDFPGSTHEVLRAELKRLFEENQAALL